MSAAFTLRIALLTACLGLLPQPAWVAEAPDPTSPPARGAEEEHGSAASAIDVRKLFAAQCAWCHADYGMKAGKGPRLAGTRLTERQVYNTIRNGKADAMPPFRRTLTEEQIQAFASYIKGLERPD
jgi:mono/diheme cytochrome c family protein